jgi:hypothetical protein
MNHEPSTSVPAAKKGKVSGLKKLIREVESDDEDETSVPIVHTDVAKPWMTEFTRYLETLEAALASGMSMIQWWGVSRLANFRCDTPLTICSRSMLSDTLYGRHLHAIIYL